MKTPLRVAEIANCWSTQQLCAALAAAVLLVTPVALTAAPVAGQIMPVAVYHDLDHPFGLAYDSVNDRIWYTRGDSGDSLVHSLKPLKSFTAAQLAALPVVGGEYQVSLLAAENDLAGTTSPGGSGGSGSGAHFSALAFNAGTGQLVQTSSGNVRAYDPFTAANQITISGVGTGFADGLDFDGTNRWFSPDAGNIFQNGVLRMSSGNAAQSTLPGWSGLGSSNTLGWSGCEQVGNSVFAVAVQSGADTGRSRTIVRFDANTYALLGFDPDGDNRAARWEDLAFDGRYLYAADLRGNANSNGVIGDVYVFDVTGGLSANDFEISPLLATNQVGTSHMVCATVTLVTNGMTNPVVGTTVAFAVTSGPNTGTNGSSVTDSNGIACFTYVDTGGVGTDTIVGSFVDGTGLLLTATARKIWEQSSNRPPVAVCTNVTVSADGTCTASASVDGGSYDPDGDLISLVQTPPGPYPLGTTTVTLTVSDGKASSSCTATVTVVDTTPPSVLCPATIVATNDPGQCSAVVTYVAVASDCNGIASFSCTPPSGSVFPKGNTTVTCTAVDGAGNTNSCAFTVTVVDGEAPLVTCRPASNPAGKKIPVAGKTPASGQNPDGFYQVLSKDNCDPDPLIYFKDSASAFIAGPFHSGDIVKITQSPDGTPEQKPMAGVVVAHIKFNGDPLLYAVDASGNASVPANSCLVPPPPK